MAVLGAKKGGLREGEPEFLGEGLENILNMFTFLGQQIFAISV